MGQTTQLHNPSAYNPSAYNPGAYNRRVASQAEILAGLASQEALLAGHEVAGDLVFELFPQAGFAAGEG